MPTRPSLLIRIADVDGCLGWGEVWANFPPRANIHKAHTIEDVVSPLLRGMAFIEPREALERLRGSLHVYFRHVGQSHVLEHILAGIDIALWDLALRKAGQSFVAFMGLSKSSAPTYASSINKNDFGRLIPYHAGLGQKFFKIKIGFLNGGDRGLVQRAYKLCPSGTRIMVDSNQSWKLERAKAALNSLEEFKPLFAEEPLPADARLSDWEQLARSTCIPLAGGENIYGAENFLAMASAGLKFIQPDVAKWGGVTGALDLASKLPEGAMLWPHFMGTAIGQVAALSVAAAIGGGSVCEMDVHENGLRTELCGDALAIENGEVALPGAAGLVVPPFADRLEKFAETNH